MLKKILKIAVIIIAVLFVAIQFYRPDRTNPPETAANTLEASVTVPEDVRAVLGRSCVDCHSNRSVYPWYSNISPVSWFLQNHITEGRHELNISEWNTYETRKKVRKLDEICEQVKEGEMPLPSYLWIHWDAAMQPGDARKLCDWTDAEKARLQNQPPQ